MQLLRILDEVSARHFDCYDITAALHKFAGLSNVPSVAVTSSFVTARRSLDDGLRYVNER
jgi:hypothetical protein